MRRRFAVIVTVLAVGGCGSEESTPPPPASAPAKQPAAASPQGGPRLVIALRPEAPVLRDGAVVDPPPVTRVGAGSKSVQIKRGDRWEALATFKRAQNVFDHAVSPDRTWVYVWHHDYPPRKLSIYAAAYGKLNASFTPGFGGRMSWTPAGTILHVWRNGTDWRAFCVYRPDGTTAYSGGACTVAVSPHSRFLVAMPTAIGTEPPWILDLADGPRKISISDDAHDIRAVWQATWQTPRILELEYLTSEQVDSPQAGQRPHRVAIHIVHPRD